MNARFRTFREFYPFYLSQHVHPTCRRLHFLGIASILLLILAAALLRRWWLLAFIPVAGYGLAWIGHYVFEKNRPATFTYPFYSLAGDWVMFFQLLTGRIKFK